MMSPALPVALAALAAAAAVPVERASVPAPNGARVEVLAQGSGPLVVLLPSRGRGAEDFDAVAALIAAGGYRVLRPQPRGIGGSTGPQANAAEGTTLHDYARDVAAAIEAEGRGPAVVVGHAFGHFVVSALAVDRPDLVRGVVLAAAAARGYPQTLSAAIAVCSDPAQPPVARLAALREAFFAPGHDPHVWLDGWHHAADEAQAAASQATPRSDWWGAGRAPILELQADLDPFKTAAQRGDLAREFGGRVTVAVIPEASHALMPEQPEAVAREILSWMARLPP